MTMENCVQICLILLVLMLSVIVTQATVVENRFKKLDPEQNITGTLGAELKARSSQECSLRCLSNKECKAYKYMRYKEGNNCVLIQNNSTVDGGQLFTQDKNSGVYEKGLFEESLMLPSEPETTWNKPSAWTGPEAALYQSFDNSNSSVLWEGTLQIGEVTLVSGKVNFALSLDHTQSQWIDLGIHTEACMTRPETCGAAGGAISLWVKLIACPGGIISSFGPSTGSVIYCSATHFQFEVFLPNEFIAAWYPRPTGWTHIVLNYRGPNDGEGIRIYYDGTEVASNTTRDGGSYSAGDGRIVVGRVHTNHDERYASVVIDELIYFNAALTDTEVQLIYNSTQWQVPYL